MGWFSIGNDDVIGDLPADTIQWALQRYAQDAEQKPTLHEVLLGLETVLHEHEHDYLDPATAKQWPIGHLALRGEVIANQLSQDLPSSLTETLRGTIEGLVNAYEMTLERKPRLSEVLACFIFALQGDLSSILHNADNLSLKKGDIFEVR